MYFDISVHSKQALVLSIRAHARTFGSDVGKTNHTTFMTINSKEHYFNSCYLIIDLRYTDHILTERG